MSRDIAWTMGSFVILALSGIAINIIVVVLRDAEALGIFNQSYAFYIIISQLAAFGIHYSVMRGAAYHASEPEQLGRLLISGALPALASGLIFAFLVAMSENWLASLLSVPTARAVTIASFGLALFPLNKVLIAFLNGVREMKAFAILQATRYIIVAVVVTIVAATDLPFEYASICFIVAEGTTVIAAAVYILARRLIRSLAFSGALLIGHLRFGGKSLMAGMFGEVNSRVDVILLGIMMGDTAAGIYSFAAMLMDGLYHLLAMVRVNLNPVLVAAVRDKAWPDAQRLLGRSRQYAPLVVGLLSAATILFYWVVTTHIVPERGLQAGLPVLIILLSGLTLVSAYIPFDNLLLAGGYPGYQTLQQFLAVAANVVLNVVLIPPLGILGAAIGAAMSYVVGIALLMYYARRFFGWRLLSNKVTS